MQEHDWRLADLVEENRIVIRHWKQKKIAGMVAHPVTQVIGDQALVDILDLSEVAWTCWGVSTASSGLGLRMVKELDLQLALAMNERR